MQRLNRFNMKKLKTLIVNYFGTSNEAWADDFFEQLEQIKRENQPDTGDKMDITNTKYVLATEEFREKCIAGAIAWQDNEHQVIYESDMEARYVAAEFIANLQGFTLYENNAAYPKKNE